MELDIKKAFLSPFSEKRWYIKLIFPCTTMILILILLDPPLMRTILIPDIAVWIIAIACIPALVFLLGFFAQFIHNEISNNKPLLPGMEVKFRDYFIYGLISLGIFLIYSIPNSLLGLIKHTPAKDIGATFIVIPLLLLSLFLSIVGAFSQNAYADFFCFKDAIRFKRIFKLMFNVKLEIFIYLIIFFILDKLNSPLELGFVAAARSLHFTTTVFLLSKDFAIPIVDLVFTLMFLNLQAQIYKIAKNRLEN